MYYIGIDVGTSGMKALLVDNEGVILKEANESYPVLHPKNGWTEQDPAVWLDAAKRVLKSLSEGIEDKIAGVSCGGQMHGLVILDEHDEVIRPCILWNDGRTQRQTDFINDLLGREQLSSLTANIAFAGFTAPKIRWVKENEPENFKRIKKIMLPKDYIAYKLTGVFSTDYSDASGMLLLDVKNKCWSEKMCKVCYVQKEWLPTLYESYQVTGKILPEYNLPNAVMTAGAGDNAAAAIGTGTVENGSCNISLGTSGTIFVAQDKFSVDEKNALHSFAHANGRWHLMGCILSAASARKWWLEEILGTDDYELDEEEISKVDESIVLFLPYLTGERSPHNDVGARGAFIGLSATTTRAQMSKAVMEGVAFALRDCLEVAKSNGIKIKKTTICGGGAKSRVWKKIVANVLNLPVVVPQTEQGPSYGAAMLAMVGCGEFTTVEEAAKTLVKVKETIYPDIPASIRYDTKYKYFKALYPAMKSVFGKA